MVKTMMCCVYFMGTELSTSFRVAKWVCLYLRLDCFKTFIFASTPPITHTHTPTMPCNHPMKAKKWNLLSLTSLVKFSTPNKVFDASEPGLLPKGQIGDAQSKFRKIWQTELIQKEDRQNKRSATFGISSFLSCGLNCHKLLQWINHDKTLQIIAIIVDI